MRQLLSFSGKAWLIVFGCSCFFLLLVILPAIFPTQQKQLLRVAQSYYDALPRLPDAEHVFQEESACGNCLYAGVEEGYRTNRSWSEVVAFYKSHLNGSTWQCSEPSEYTLLCRTEQLYQGGVSISKRQIYGNKSDTTEATEFSVEVSYAKDWELFKETCPTFSYNPTNCDLYTWHEGDLW